MHIETFSTEKGNMPKNSKDKKQLTLPVEKIAEFKELLIKKRQELNGNAVFLREEGLEHSVNNGSTTPMHIAELGTDTFNQDLALSRLEHGEELLMQIEEALERIKLGTFGTCLRCDNPMKIGRLEIVPWATYCIACQERIEKL